MARFDGVIFDMDGTLVVSPLDFAWVRREIGAPEGTGILEAIEAMAPAERAAARQRLLACELVAARQARLMPHAAETLQAITAAGLKTALLTRNAREVMEMILRRFDLRFDLSMSREDGPIKPEPDGVLRTCRELGVPPRRAVCVGDYHYDITAARAAGTVSVLLVGPEPPAWADEADHVIRGLDDLPDVLGI